jgi:glutaredoxin
MNDIVVYTKQNCKFCIKAKKLLNENKMKFGEISLDNDDTCNEFFKYLRCNLSNKKDIPKTVPQIFIKGVRIGGFTYLYERLSVKNTENKSIMITNNENQLLDNLQAEFESECVSCQA